MVETDWLGSTFSINWQMTRIDHEAIFEPGRRATGSGGTAVASQGAGLGLALSRRLARTAGGDVYAEHGDTDGGRFVVRLPTA